jgi:hypothetical protein
MYKQQNPQTAAIMSIGMKALEKALGTLDAELFLVMIKQGEFDYTEWRRENLWPGLTSDEIMARAANNFPQNSFGLEKNEKEEIQEK